MLLNTFNEVNIILIPEVDKDIILKKKRVETGNDGHRCRNPQQNLRKPNSTVN